MNENTNWIEMYFSELWITYMNDTIVKEKFGIVSKLPKLLNTILELT